MTVSPGRLGDVLEGAVRPGHFRGVLTVVAKLFGLVRPDLAVFGEKDYQQLVLVRRMVADLCLGVEVVGGETCREPDGLAMSSRNRYLDPEARARAAALPRALLGRPGRPGPGAGRRPGDRAGGARTGRGSSPTTSSSPAPTSASCRPSSRPPQRPGSWSPSGSAAPG